MNHYLLDPSIIQKMAGIIKNAIENDLDLDSFIVYLANNLVDSQGLGEYAGKVRVFDEEKKGSKVKGKYIKDTKELHFYRAGLKHFYDDFAKGIPDIFTEEQQKAIKYFCCTKVIVHEIEHLKQAISAEKGERDNIRDLVNLFCDRYNGLMAQMGYRLMGKYHPTERYADYVGFESAASVCDMLGEDYKKIATLLRVINVTSCIDGYLGTFDEEKVKPTDGPTYYCMLEFAKKDQFDEFKKMVQEKQPSFEERLFLGIELSEKEIESVMDYRQELINSLQIPKHGM